MEKLPNFNFFIQEINKYWQYTKIVQEKKCMYLTSYLPFAQETILIVT